MFLPTDGAQEEKRFQPEFLLFCISPVFSATYVGQQRNVQRKRVFHFALDQRGYFLKLVRRGFQDQFVMHL